MEATITKDKLEKYLALAQRALDSLKLRKTLSSEEKAKAERLIDMSKRYFSDSEHFRKEGKLVDAFTAVNYSHAFLDALALAGWLDAKGRSDLFMID